jgi:hypothetical protein
MLLFPFKAYIFMGFPFLALCHRLHGIVQPHFYGYPEEANALVSAAYLVCLKVLAVGALAQAAFARRSSAIQTLLFVLLGLLYYWGLWPWGTVRR